MPHSPVGPAPFSEQPFSEQPSSEQPSSDPPCSVHAPVETHARERGVRAVVLLTFGMMLVEIVVGYWTGSMALLADGWHMATHVAALGMASAAYALSRRFAQHRAFALGTGKIHALAGYTSAVALGLVALVMMGESAARLLHSAPIDFEGSLPVAVLGLLVNLASFRLLHGGSSAASHDAESEAADEHEHEHEHDAEHEHDHAHHHHHPHEPADHHDHNHRAAVLHVAADALTSLFAIVALLAGKYLGYTWLDPLMGIVGSVVILKWGADPVQKCRIRSAECRADAAPARRRALDAGTNR